eukprot:CAMPEP_0117664952 /NCGR_PEP_ID=MMETSP0804-20121206/9523_1 /TAXON_ID=1074897 /ORGANISM="Tetraselmis astigmatica, Strain CCMP880" /LENGTH=205 /DNA_ID=CAMNT_0005472277 /DNA_START=1651 /DNA_END=2269 /DNA_ORIENTATION=+
MVLDQAPIEILEAFAEVGMYADLEPPVVVELGGRALLVTFEGLVAHQLLASLEESDAEVASPSHTSEVPIADPSPLGGGIPNASIEVQVRAFPATSITFPCEGYLHLRARCEIDTLKVGMQGGWLLHWTPPNAAWHWLDQALAPGLYQPLTGGASGFVAGWDLAASLCTVFASRRMRRFIFASSVDPREPGPPRSLAAIASSACG